MRRVLAIGGSDSSGRAGLQMDLRTIAAHGCLGLSVVTAVTAQGPRGVTAVHLVPPEIVAAQLDALLVDDDVDAIKVGMLGTAATVEAVVRALAPLSSTPIVVDPVLAASSGEALLSEDAIAPLVEKLFPLAALVTPNLPEAARLSGLPVDTDEERVAAAQRLAGPITAVLLKGGHGDGDELVDLLLDGKTIERFAHPRLRRGMRGTGCALATAAAARLARGEELADAVRGAIDYVHREIAAATAC
jgi:hydroxymethylpyrimidine/phosphomethylpyrimidine kinase